MALDAAVAFVVDKQRGEWLSYNGEPQPCSPVGCQFPYDILSPGADCETLCKPPSCPETNQLRGRLPSAASEEAGALGKSLLTLVAPT